MAEAGLYVNKQPGCPCMAEATDTYRKAVGPTAGNTDEMQPHLKRGDQILCKYVSLQLLPTTAAMSAQQLKGWMHVPIDSPNHNQEHYPHSRLCRKHGTTGCSTRTQLNINITQPACDRFRDEQQHYNDMAECRFSQTDMSPAYFAYMFDKNGCCKT